MAVFAEHKIQTDTLVSDDDIKHIAQLSHKYNGSIHQRKLCHRYQTVLRYVDDDNANVFKIIIDTEDKEQFLANSKMFFRKFIEYNGDIDVGQIFGQDVMYK